MPEELIPPREEAAASPPPPQAEEQPMMKFSDLEAMVEQSKAADPGQGNETPTPLDQQAAPETGQATADPFAEALNKKGFKTPDDLLKSYEEAHATITRLAQDRAKLAQDMEVLMQIQNAYAQSASPAQPQTDGQGGFDEELYKEIAPKVAREVDQRVEANLHEIVLKSKVEQKAKENPEEFAELNPIMLGLLKQYPQVGALPNGFEMVYEKAKEVRNHRVSSLIKSVFGPNADVDKMRSFFSQQAGETQPPQQPNQANQTLNQDLARAAYLPAGSAHAIQNDKPPDYDSQIKGLMQNGKVSRETPDKVLDLWWQKVNAQSQAR